MDNEQSNKEKNKSPQKIEIQLDPNILQGAFSNVANIGHTKEEFILDFLFIQQQPAPFGKLVSRIIATPNHAKRIASVLQDNIQKYEQKYGTIDDSVVPPPMNKTLQ